MHVIHHPQLCNMSKEQTKKQQSARTEREALALVNRQRPAELQGHLQPKLQKKKALAYAQEETCNMANKNTNVFEKHTRKFMLSQK